MNTPPKPANFPALTGIRAVAAYMVFVHHFNFFSAKYFGQAIHLFFSEFHVGVTLFFVLSGLLLYLKYSDVNFRKSPLIYNYIINRIARIYPLCFLILILSIIVYYSSGYFDTISAKTTIFYFVTGFTLTRGFFAESYHFFVAQAWSLTVEECFYILCPAFFLLIKKRLDFIVWLPLAFIVAGCLLVFFLHGANNYGFLKDYRFLFNFTFFGRCIEFFSGIALGAMYKKISPSPVKAVKFTLLGMAGIVACIIGLAALHTQKNYGDYHPVGIIINNLVLPITGISALYWGLLTERNAVTRVLASRLFILLGKASYAFYLIHVGFIADWFMNNVSMHPVLLFLYLNVMAILLYQLFEHPVNEIIRKKFRVTVKPASAISH
jgi:peptidoglycan/LPS O-acetylase OafA/YrhL